jgi:hypothetical protein
VYNTAQVDSNGALFFGTPDPTYSDITCMPNVVATYVIAPYWTDQDTSGSGQGVFTSVSGSAPNRIFNIEWRNVYFGTTTQLNYEVRLYEGQNTFHVIYGLVNSYPPGNDSALTVGVQKDTSTFTEYGCDGSGGTNPPVSTGQDLTFTLGACGSPTNTPTHTPTVPPTNTPTTAPTHTATTAPATATSTTVAATATRTTGPATATAAATSPAATATRTTAPATSTATPVQPTPTACTLQFTDVPVGSTFYPYIHCLVCLGIVNGYADGTFRPNNPVTRGQLSKIVANSAGFNDTPTGQQFQDVPVGSTFYAYIYRLVIRGYISGYPCGGQGEPCVPPANLPYFRPNAYATRGQISKIVSNAAGFNDIPSGQQFQDVPPQGPGSTFYVYIYRLSHRGIISGYACGGPGEPCVPPQNLPYFRPNADATRGQMSKIDAAAFFPDCNIPARPQGNNN